MQPEAPAPPSPDPSPDSLPDRSRWLSILARADAAAIATCLREAPPLPGFIHLRGPESGLVMLRGRIGGNGDAFNLGEMTLSRCSIRDEAGRVGHGYASGRDLAQVELIARLDAALQDSALYPSYCRAVLAPLAARESARRAALASRAAGTRVEFATLAIMR